MYKKFWYLIIFLAAQSLPVAAVGYTPMAGKALNATLVKTVKAGLLLGVGAGIIQQYRLANRRLEHMRNNGYQAEADAAEYGVADLFREGQRGPPPVIQLLAVGGLLEGINVYASLLLGITLITKKHPAPGGIVGFQHMTNIKLAAPLFGLAAAAMYLNNKIAHAERAYDRAVRPAAVPAFAPLGQQNIAPGAVLAANAGGRALLPPL